MDMHGGSIGAESQGLGRGSTFTVRLPARSATTVATDAVSSGPGATGESRRILVVDDNIDAADSLAMLLETLGHETRTAHTGPAALDVHWPSSQSSFFWTSACPG